MFKWNQEYCINIEEIDSQHKKLFELGESLYKLANNENGNYDSELLMDIIEELCEYTVYHFDSEERYFEKYDYNHAKEHIKQHQYFIEFLHKLDIDDIEHHTSKSLRELLNFINDWIINHIKISDLKFSIFLNKAF